MKSCTRARFNLAHSHNPSWTRSCRFDARLLVLQCRWSSLCKIIQSRLSHGLGFRSNQALSPISNAKPSLNRGSVACSRSPALGWLSGTPSSMRGSICKQKLQRFFNQAVFRSAVQAIGRPTVPGSHGRRATRIPMRLDEGLLPVLRRLRGRRGVTTRGRAHLRG